MYESSLVLEGGATRGIFTSGVLDYFMEQNLKLSDIVGVSAGSFNAVNYVSWQRDRTRKCLLRGYTIDHCVSLKDFLLKKQLVDMEQSFDNYAKDVYPFDYDEYFSSDMKAELVATNCLSGKAEYLVPKTKEDVMLYSRASCSMPMLVHMVEIDKVPYLDGGISNAIPLEHALSKELRKNVFILTRPKGFRKPMPGIGTLRVQHMIYEDYPELFYKLRTAPKRYNLILDFLEKLEDEGRIFVIRPEEKPISHFENNPDKINSFYQHGYDIGKREYENLINYLES